MLTFPCPSCNTPIHAAEDLVGKSILCPHCGLAATVASAAITTLGALPAYPSSTGVTTANVVEAAEQARRRRDAEVRAEIETRTSGTIWQFHDTALFANLNHWLVAIGIIYPSVLCGHWILFFPESLWRIECGPIVFFVFLVPAILAVALAIARLMGERISWVAIPVFSIWMSLVGWVYTWFAALGGYIT